MDQPIVVGDGGESGSGGTGGGMPAEPSCTDGKKNGAETGMDCGMDACGMGCDAGMGCTGDIDCKVGLCTNMVCQAASCHDMLLNGGETDKDCGGDMGCDRCTPGLRCMMTSDCDGGACVNGQCKAPSCKDELLNGDETDMDCGGSCSTKCGSGENCGSSDDCDVLLCAKGKCQPAACDDKLLNQDESAVDCGGSCTPCDDGVDCNTKTDCKSGVCGTDKSCSIPSCTDGVKNGKEPTADCGIDCLNKCKTLDACNVDNDCVSGDSCQALHCIPKTPNNKALSPLNWVATASHTFSVVNSPPSLAIDGNNDTGDWITGATQEAGMWFDIDMVKTQYVFSVELVNNDTPDTAKEIDIAFSDTDTDWETVEPVLSRYSPSAKEVIKLPQVGIGRYMRITLTQGKNNWWRLDEVRCLQ